MRVFLFIVCAIAGAVIAWGLNRFFEPKIKDKFQEKRYKILLISAVYTVFIVLGLFFAAITSARYLLDAFLINRIAYIETTLSRTFPNTNIMEMTIDSNELKSFTGEFSKLSSGINTSDDSFFEKLVYDAFTSKLNVYIRQVEQGVNLATAHADESGLITVKSVLFNIKDAALDAISPYVKFVQILIVIIAFICVGIYHGIVVFVQKGGAMYNKSLVFGEGSDGELKF